MAEIIDGLSTTRPSWGRGATPTAPIVAQAPQFRPLRSDAYENLREAILLGRLRPGERVVEAEIARQMGISRGPVREAVRQLEHEDLVEYHPRQGAIVAPLTREAVADTYAVRAELDGFAARLAVAHLGDEHLDHLCGLLAMMRRQAGAGDSESLLDTDVEFHRHICTVAGNRVLLRTWTGLGPHAWTLFSGIRLRGYSLGEIAERHLPIIEALRARDAKGAEWAAKEHTMEIARNVLSHLDESVLDSASDARRGSAVLYKTESDA